MFSSENFQVSTSDGRNFVLVEDVTYMANDGTIYVMPVGATSDGASTPPGVWPAIPPFGKYWKAAFLHDCAYRNTLQIESKDTPNPVRSQANLPKDKCDSLLREAMIACGVDILEVDIIYEAVVVGGASSFDGDRKT